MNKIDRRGIQQWLGTGNQLSEAIEILMDMFNGDYTVRDLKMDIRAYYEPDDRGDMNR